MMELSREEIQKIVERVAREMLQKMQKDAPPRTLAVIPGYVYRQAAVTEYLCALQADVALPEGGQVMAGSLRLRPAQTPEDRQKLIAELEEYDEVVLVTPQLSLIRELAAGRDESFAAQLVLRPLLWGRRTTLLLDFAAKFRRGTMFAEFCDVVDSLEKAGMHIAVLPQQNAGPDEPKDLVCEQDVKDAARSGKKSVRIRDGAIVTQLAQDTARELGVTIEYTL